jgi:hypothetical protein
MEVDRMALCVLRHREAYGRDSPTNYVFPVLFTLIASVLCLPAQIFMYIWMFERDFIRAAVSVAGVFAMLPLLHFLPIPSRSMRDKRRLTIPPFHRGRNGTNMPGDGVLPAPMSLPR